MNTSIEFLYGEVLWGNGSVNGLTSVAGQIKHPGEGGDCAPNIAYQKDIFITKGLRKMRHIAMCQDLHGMDFDILQYLYQQQATTIKIMKR